jgi:glucose-6-phosphate-specific signal transduction histidine kinase
VSAPFRLNLISFVTFVLLRRRLLAEERKALHQLRQNYTQELKSRTELEALLRQCVEDVRKEIARRY